MGSTPSFSVNGWGGFSIAPSAGTTLGSAVNYTAKTNGNEMTVTRESVAPTEGERDRGLRAITFTLKKE